MIITVASVTDRIRLIAVTHEGRFRKRGRPSLVSSFDTRAGFLFAVSRDREGEALWSPDSHQFAYCSADLAQHERNLFSTPRPPSPDRRFISPGWIFHSVMCRVARAMTKLRAQLSVMSTPNHCVGKANVLARLTEKPQSFGNCRRIVRRFAQRSAPRACR